MIDQLLPFLKNVKAGPKTTVTGALLILLSCYLFITSVDIVDTIINSGLLVIGIVLLFLKDWQPKNKENE